MLMSQRPSAFRSIIWHGVLRMVYFVLGMCALVFSIFELSTAYSQYTTAMKVLKGIEELAPGSNQYTKELPSYLYLDTAIGGVLAFLLSLALFLLARYCRKITRRNLYIMETENLWNTIKNATGEKQVVN